VKFGADAERHAPNFTKFGRVLLSNHNQHKEPITNKPTNKHRQSQQAYLLEDVIESRRGERELLCWKWSLLSQQLTVDQYVTGI